MSLFCDYYRDRFIGYTNAQHTYTVTHTHIHTYMHTHGIGLSIRVTLNTKPASQVLINPIEVTHQTTGSSILSLSSRGVGFYLQYAVVIIGVVGTAANALVLYTA